ncbi:MAG TPA: NAD(P)/FAD-dependent oxidoreductase [Solirubrobacteraceae bacterium]|nr:NAD(P)/FAD-dependent oxidoreductase [Solirubrobacteraceae bacterium]
MNPEHVDVLIVGAGLSGIGAACHLRRECPRKTFAIIEARESIGGTWDLFRYPGIRSDSDMFTLGYSFRPWDADTALADGPSILSYVRETAREHAIEQSIRFGQRVVRARWSSPDARWTVELERGDEQTLELTCEVLYCCTGYYRYDEGYSPAFAGSERFRGQIVHPQHWPESLDCAGKRVAVIGSGATAVTLVPALARSAEHVTMVQRSPTYIVSVPERDPLAERLRGRLAPALVYSIVRWKNVLLMMLNFQLCRRYPGLMRRLFLGMARKRLPAGYDLERHLSPTYNPWDQRVCAVPDGDLFNAICDGRASIETGRIETFTETGIRMSAGNELPADVIVTATGLNMLALGGIELVVDGAQVELGKSVTYKGMMLCGVPNMVLTLGYTNASWTLKADLVGEYLCRLLNYMDERGLAVFVPQPPDPSSPVEPIMDLKAGYVLRAIEQLPKQGVHAPWRLHQNYVKDIRLLRHGPIDDAMEFRARTGAAEQPATVALAA